MTLNNLFQTRAANGLGTHLEQLADHARTLADILLHQLAADDADEAGVRAVGHRARQQRLARACSGPGARAS